MQNINADTAISLNLKFQNIYKPKCFRASVTIYISKHIHTLLTIINFALSIKKTSS